MLRLLALCHSVIIDPSNGSYNSSSPDETALVDGAATCGYRFHSRDNEKNIKIKLGENVFENYKLMNILDFDSTRKRMSVIVYDEQT